MSTTKTRKMRQVAHATGAKYLEGKRSVGIRKVDVRCNQVVGNERKENVREWWSIFTHGSQETIYPRMKLSDDETKEQAKHRTKDRIDSNSNVSKPKLQFYLAHQRHELQLNQGHICHGTSSLPWSLDEVSIWATHRHNASWNRQIEP